jgi:hypothetical protein
VSFRIEQPRGYLPYPECGADNIWAEGGSDRSFRTVPIGGSRSGTRKRSSTAGRSPWGSLTAILEIISTMIIRNS